MTSPLQIRNQSKQIENKAKLVFSNVKRNYQQGKIQSETDYLYQIFQAMQDFYTSIGVPTMKVRSAWGPPFSADYNATLTEIYNDITTLYDEAQNLYNVITNEYRQVEVDRQNLDRRVKQVEDRLRAIEAANKRQLREIVFRDSFISRGMYDSNGVEGIPAHVSPEEGMLMLQPLQAEEFSDGVTVSILVGSNGFPGNTHQARAVKNGVAFTGANSLHIDLTEILDNNTNTWFEFEAFEVADSTMEDMAGFGFEYKEGIRWVLDHGDTCRLLLELELPDEEIINWFSLKPFIPSDRGAVPAVITSIKVIDRKGKETEMLTEKQDFALDQAFLFGKESCQRIIVTMEQAMPYETTIGHLYYKEVDSTGVSYFELNRSQERRRIDGAAPSIEYLGYKYDIAKQTVTPPSMTVGEDTLFAVTDATTSVVTAGTIPYTLDQLQTGIFGAPVVDTGVEAGYELIPAWRYAIGIRDANIASYQFAESSEYRSWAYTSAQHITSLSLEVDVDIPDSFGEGDWVQYHFTIDGGKNWYRIYPRGTTKEGAKIMYYFNTDTPQAARFDEVGYIDQTDLVKQVRFRITMKRPNLTPEDMYLTPVIREYRLYAVTIGGLL